jgi:hypothetical protein
VKVLEISVFMMGAKQDRLIGIGKSRAVGWMPNSPKKLNANDNFAPQDFALAA